MQGTAGIEIAKNADLLKSLKLRRARELWLIRSDTLTTGTIGATPMTGASDADNKKPPATPVAP